MQVNKSNLIISFPNFIKLSHASTRAKLQVLPETLDIYISFCFRFVISMVPKFFGTITDTDIRRLFRLLFFNTQLQAAAITENYKNKN